MNLKKQELYMHLKIVQCAHLNIVDDDQAEDPFLDVHKMQFYLTLHSFCKWKALKC